MTENCIMIIVYIVLTEKFYNNRGVHQGCSMSSTLLDICIDDIVGE